MKKILSIGLVLLLLVGCTTANNTPNNNGNEVVNEDVVAKVGFDGVVYEETEEVLTELTSDWFYSGTIKDVVADEELANSETTFVSNKLEVGTEVYTSNAVEGSILVATGEGEFTTFSAAE